MRLSRTVYEILSLIFQKKSRDSDYTTFRDNLSSELLAIVNMHTKFEVSSLSRSRDILGGLKFKMGHVTTPISGTVCRL